MESEISYSRRPITCRTYSCNGIALFL